MVGVIRRVTVTVRVRNMVTVSVRVMATVRVRVMATVKVMVMVTVRVRQRTRVLETFGQTWYSAPPP